MKLDKIKEAFRNCHSTGIQTVGYFILGLPGETVQDLKKTIDLSIELDCDFASFNNAIPIIGTDLRDEVIKNNLIENKEKIDEYDGSFTPTIETNELTRDIVNQIRISALKRFYLRPRYILKRLLRLKNFYQVKMLFSEAFRLIKNLFINKNTASDFM